MVTGSHLEQAVDDRRNQVVSAHTAKEGAKGPSAASVHFPDKESEQGSSSVSSAHTAKESDQGSSVTATVP